MLIDSALYFSNNQTVSIDGNSTNYIDLGSLKNIGIGEPLAIVVHFPAVATGSIVINVQTDDNSSFSSPVVIATSGSVTPGAKSKVVIPIPPDTRSERYIRLYYDVTITSGSYTITSYITKADKVQNEVVYPVGYTIK